MTGNPDESGVRVDGVEGEKRELDALYERV